MDTNPTPLSPDAASADAAVFPATPASLPAHPEERPSPVEDASRRSKRIGWFEGHMPEIVDPLVPQHPDTSLTQTRRLRHDGWSPDKMRLFLARFAECGVLVEACEAAGMSARSAYNLRDRDPLFAAGWEAARVQARQRLADEVYSRAVNGVVDRIYKDGVIVAERHRYDNRLTMSVLARLDARLDRAEERGESHLALVARWDDYLDAVGEGRREEGMALLAPPEPAPQPDLQKKAGHRELHEHCCDGAAATICPNELDPHDVWEDAGRWWTNYPPPPGFDGEEEGRYEDEEYRRTLSPAEQAVIDADGEALHAEAAALRDAYFGLERSQSCEPAKAVSASADAEPVRPEPVQPEPVRPEPGEGPAPPSSA